MTTTGQYLLFQASSASTSQSNYIISSILNITYDKDHCLTMWYFEDGESAFGVDVYMVMPRYNIVANRFSSAIENRRRWNLFKADIQYNPGYMTNCKLFSKDRTKNPNIIFFLFVQPSACRSATPRPPTA